MLAIARDLGLDVLAMEMKKEKIKLDVGADQLTGGWLGHDQCGWLEENRRKLQVDLDYHCVDEFFFD